jgi:hypothetical protein
MEPTTGIEPATYSLQNCCSTVEPRRRGYITPLFLQVFNQEIITVLATVSKLQWSVGKMYTEIPRRFFIERIKFVDTPVGCCRVVFISELVVSFGKSL